MMEPRWDTISISITIIPYTIIPYTIDGKTATPAWSLEYGIYGLWAMDYGLWSMRSGICWGRSVHSTIWGLFVWFTVFNYAPRHADAVVLYNGLRGASRPQVGRKFKGVNWSGGTQMECIIQITPCFLPSHRTLHCVPCPGSGRVEKRTNVKHKGQQWVAQRQLTSKTSGSSSGFSNLHETKYIIM